MNFVIWLDGVVLKVDLTDVLYRKYKGEKIEELEVTTEVFPDWYPFLEKLRQKVSNDKIVFLSPYDKETTKKVMESLAIANFSYVSNDDGITKPSKIPYKALFNMTRWDPMETMTIGSSPLDLLSARFFDSRIKVACVKRFQDCSRYSPYIMADSLEKLYEILTRLRKL
ncbi:MAG: HAD family hydrolase [Sulfolobaceae archaeon]|jgi:hypothetical protein